MKIYDGRYSWDGKKRDGVEPITWFPGSYNLKIFSLTDGRQRVTFLKPYLCIYSETGEGMSISARPEKFAQQISSEFSLPFEKVLWAEESPAGSGQFEVLVFTESGRMGAVKFYTVARRKPLSGEIQLISQQLAALA